MMKVKGESFLSNVGANSVYEMRAPPRRRKDTNDKPIFLRKAFSMIDECPDDIGGWSSKGETFIIRDVKKFSDEIIPKYYKHNNFSSFVRQLNFYGFRKVKSDHVMNADWWEFRHPLFRRDEPEKIAEIKRSVHFESSDQNTEIVSLRNEINSLRDKLESMTMSINYLTNHVGKLMGPCEVPLSTSSISSGETMMEDCESEGYMDSYDSFADDEVVVKKRKAMGSTNNSTTSSLSNNRENLLTGNQLKKMDIFESDGPLLTRINSYSSVQSNESWDDSTFDTLLQPSSLASLDIINDVPVQDESIESEGNICNDSPNARECSPTCCAPSQDITAVFSAMSRDQQERFVDKLAENMSTKLANVLSSISCAAAPVSSRSVCDETSLPKSSPCSQELCKTYCENFLLSEVSTLLTHILASFAQSNPNCPLNKDCNAAQTFPLQQLIYQSVAHNNPCCGCLPPSQIETM